MSCRHVELRLVGGESVTPLGENAAGHAVRPGTDQQAVAGPGRRDPQGARQEDVVPAADHQRRRAFSVRGGGQPAPVGVVAGVLQPLAVVGGEPVQQRQRPPGCPVEVLDAVQRLGHRADVRGGAAGPLDLSVQQVAEHPVQAEPELEGAAQIRPALVRVGSGDVRGEGPKCGRCGGCRVPLRDTLVGPPDHADGPVAPVLAGGPPHGVPAVRGVVGERPEDTVGRVPAAHVLHHEAVPGLHKPHPVQGAAPAEAPFPYGVRRRRAGSGREVSGRYTSARSTTPSLMDMGTSRSITSRTGVSSQPTERV